MSEEASEQEFNEHGESLIDGGKVMSLWDHLGELRSRAVKGLIAIVLIFIVAMIFSRELIDLLKIPLMQALPAGNNVLHFTGPMDVFISSIKVSILVSLILGCPVWLWHLWRFLEPGLYPSERKYVLPFIFISVALFFAGVGFAQIIVLPLALDFLIGYGIEVGTPIITIRDYFSMLTLLLFGFGLAFETPVLLVLMGLLDIVSAEDLRKYRQFVMIGILVGAAALTPPDPITQVALALPLFIMYEMSILIIKFIKRKDQKDGNASV